MASPTPHSVGQPLFPSNPPSRTISRAEGSIQFIDPENRRGNISSGRPGLTPPSLSSESSVAQTIQFDRLGGLIPEEQIVELRQLVSFQGLQKQKLATVGSYLTTLCDETFGLRESAASLTGRVDRVLSDMVQLLMDGDNILSNLGRAFDRPPNNGESSASAAVVSERLPIEQLSSNRREVSQEASHLEHDNDNYCAEGSEIPPSGNITIRDVRPIAQDATE